MPIKMLLFMSSHLRRAFRLSSVTRARREFVELLARDLARRAEVADVILGPLARAESERGLRPEARGPLEEPEGVVPVSGTSLFGAGVRHLESPPACGRSGLFLLAHPHYAAPERAA